MGEERFVPTPEDAILEKRFNSLIDTAILPYKKLVSEYKLMGPETFNRSQLHPVKLSVDKDWSSTEVNARASWGAGEGDEFAEWTIYFYGGLFRRPEITEDGFSLVICHEIGHLFGGFPFHKEGLSGIVLGLAAESEADYFATHSCLRSLWGNADNSPPYNGFFGDKVYVEDLPQKVINQCNSAWETEKNRQVCYRIANASLSVGKLWGAIDESLQRCNSVGYPWPCYPKYDTPDARVVDNTILTHLNAQCRLDTYVSGALCIINFDNIKNDMLIPGVFKHLPENSLRARDESFSRSCVRPPREKSESFSFTDVYHPIPNGNLSGARPRCWFEPYDIVN